MSNPTEIELSGPAHLVEPPIIDLLVHEPELRSYVAEFVPDAQISSERKESVYISDNSQTARRVSELMHELSTVLNAKSPIIKVAHAGGGNFDLYGLAGEAYHLHESGSPQFSFEVYAILQVLAQEVQLEFITQRRTNQSRAAS